MWSYIKQHLQSTILILALLTGLSALGFGAPWASKADNDAAHAIIVKDQNDIRVKLGNMDGKLDILIQFAKEKKK